jgi:hypothetical protein
MLVRARASRVSVTPGPWALWHLRARFVCVTLVHCGARVVPQLVSAVNALLTTKGEAATTAEERRALEAATMVLATPGALGSSDMVSESRAERLDPISALQLRMVHMGLRP